MVDDRFDLQERYLNRVYAFMSAHVKDRSEAERLAFETFKIVFQRLPKLPKGTDLDNWILGIARGRVPRMHRRRDSLPVAEEPAPDHLRHDVIGLMLHIDPYSRPKLALRTLRMSLAAVLVLVALIAAGVAIQPRRSVKSTLERISHALSRVRVADVSRWLDHSGFTLLQSREY